ncbi:MAG: hypothetical protein WC756_15595 [Taibaiella sp.]|jgi:hypothetical protein
MQPRKYQIQSDKPYPHMGELVRMRLRQKGVSNAILARKLNITPIGVTRYFGRGSLQAGILWNISVAIGYNLFAEMGMSLPVPYKYAGHEEAIIILKEQCTEKDKRIAELEKELSIYKSIVHQKP